MAEKIDQRVAVEDPSEVHKFQRNLFSGKYLPELFNALGPDAAFEYIGILEVMCNIDDMCINGEMSSKTLSRFLRMCAEKSCQIRKNLSKKNLSKLQKIERKAFEDTCAHFQLPPISHQEVERAFAANEDFMHEVCKAKADADFQNANKKTLAQIHSEWQKSHPERNPTNQIRNGPKFQ
jgi:hypothetical protein